MDSDSQHPFKDLDWRLDVGHARLLAPGSVTWCVATLNHRYAEVLMPADFPIGSWRLVEEDAANGKCTRTEQRIREGPNLRACRERGNSWEVEEVPKARIVLCWNWQSSIEDLELDWFEKARDDREP